MAFSKDSEEQLREFMIWTVTQLRDDHNATRDASNKDRIAQQLELV